MSDQTVDSGAKAFRTLRAWPAALLAVLMIAARFGPEFFEGGEKHWMLPVFGPILCCLLLVIWWLAFSRATWRERVFGFLGLVAGAAIVLALVHPTMRGAATYLTIPVGFCLFAIAAVFLKNAAPGVRTRMAVGVGVLGFASSMLLRNEGMTGDYKFAFHPRWSRSAEETLLASGSTQTPKTTAAVNSATNALLNPEWAGFRGADRSGRSLGPKISTNWSAQAPQQLWKISVGPGWSSFAVAGKMLFTQEQRGPKETVVCYESDSGKEIWRTEVEARLDDPMGGPGPRATPTLANGALYVCGSTGIFLRLNPVDGKIVWRKDLQEIAEIKTPMWGFSSSPLVVGSIVIVCAGGDKGVLGFDTASGEVRWSVPMPIDSYGSPQLNTIAGEESVLVLSKSGLLILEPASGKVRLDYDWKIQQYRALQPHVVGSDTILLPTGMNMGTRAIRVKKSDGKYAAEELWTSRQLNPDFVDLVTHKGHIYGNDNGIFTCIDLQTGARKWKGGRYGKGQVLLLENSGLLLILSEQGRVVLVAADANEHREVASFQAIQGKTWNHPVLVGDKLYVRNSQEAAAFRLSLSGEKQIAGK